MDFEFIPLGPYKPDLPAFNSSIASRVKNVVPRAIVESRQGNRVAYGPVNGISPYSSALTARCQGAFALINSTGEVNTFAGDKNKLYQLTVNSRTWSDVSKSGGYNTATENWWDFAQFGDRMIATNFAEAPQTFISGTSSQFSDLSADAPNAKWCEVVKNFLVLGYTNDDTYGTKPQRVWWSAVEDPTTWPTPGSNTAAQQLSDFQDVVGDHGNLQRIVGELGTADAALFFEKAIYRMNFSGGAAVFTFDAAEGARGTPAPMSIVQVGTTAYYLGEDGFYAFDGTNSRPIGANKVDRTFFNEVDVNFLNRVVGSIVPQTKLIYWLFPGLEAVNGQPDKILIYNWYLDEWSIAEITLDFVFPALGYGYTLEELETFDSSLDDLEFSLDSAVWSNNRALLAGFDSNNKMGFLNATPLDPMVETSEIELGQGRRARVVNTRPILDSRGATASVAVGTREGLNQNPSFGSFIEENSNFECPQRASGRYFRFLITVNTEGSWDFLEGVRVDVKREGRR